MKSFPRGKSNELWQQYWDEMRSEFFKVEAMQDYSGEDEGRSESLRLWKGGDKEASIKALAGEPYSNFTQMSMDKVTAGIELLRIHLVKEPYPPYLEWEIEHYKHLNIPRGGERVYLAQLLDFPDCPDFMIFDLRRVAVNHYDETGRMTSADFYDAAEDDISRFLTLRERIIAKAKPLEL